MKVRIIHETNPRKYFPAIFKLAEERRINLVGEHRFSVVKEWFRALIREKKPFRNRFVDAILDCKFRCLLPFLSGEVIIIGFAPWNWRILYYWFLPFNNQIIYHTSWPYWDSKIPQTCGVLTPLFETLWKWFLRHPNVVAVCVQREVSESLWREVGIQGTVIPHAVPREFYTDSVGAVSSKLRLIFVGELSEKKGIKELIQLVLEFDGDCELTIVGNGALRGYCDDIASNAEFIKVLGPIYHRPSLAKIMADHDILMLLSKRLGTWEELFGIVITEAMASGLAVIASRHIGPLAIFESVHFGNLFEESDLIGVSDLLRQLISDPAKLLSFKSLHEQLAARYHIDFIANEWLTVIEHRSKLIRA